MYVFLNVVEGIDEIDISSNSIINTKRKEAANLVGEGVLSFKNLCPILLSILTIKYVQFKSLVQDIITYNKLYYCTEADKFSIDFLEILQIFVHQFKFRMFIFNATRYFSLYIEFNRSATAIQSYL
jgi:hypothetical protein